jgi:hypothetical protein
MLRPILASDLCILFVTWDRFSKLTSMCRWCAFCKFLSLDLLDHVLLFMVIVSHV